MTDDVELYPDWRTGLKAMRRQVVGMMAYKMGIGEQYIRARYMANFGRADDIKTVEVPL